VGEAVSAKDAGGHVLAMVSALGLGRRKATPGPPEWMPLRGRRCLPLRADACWRNQVLNSANLVARPTLPHLRRSSIYPRMFNGISCLTRRTGCSNTVDQQSPAFWACSPAAPGPGARKDPEQMGIPDR
jgi:hypothetical protein